MAYPYRQEIYLSTRYFREGEEVALHKFEHEEEDEGHACAEAKYHRHCVSHQLEFEEVSLPDFSIAEFW